MLLTFGKTNLILKIIAIGVALLVATLPIVVSQRIHQRLVKEEHLKMELWTDATEAIAGNDENAPFNILLKIISSNHTIPVILVNSKDSIIASNNISLPSSPQDSIKTLQKLQRQFAKKYSPLEIDLGNEGKQYLYYGDSYTLREINIFPLIQLPLFILLLLVLGIVWYLANRNTQNKLWAGLSKETAHQLGTPISSLMAWIELLKEEKENLDMLQEMQKDIARLETISHRFQKVGSTPQFQEKDICKLINNAISYLQSRISKEVKLSTQLPSSPILIHCNDVLLSWVIENLVKNGVDAMKGKGQMTIKVSRKEKSLVLDITDNGCGIPIKIRRKIFHPGFTTKKKGWGLGLSLARRIINEYHKGKLFILYSEVGKGTTFRIRLPLDKGSLS